MNLKPHLYPEICELLTTTTFLQKAYLQINSDFQALADVRIEYATSDSYP